MIARQATEASPQPRNAAALPFDMEGILNMTRKMTLDTTPRRRRMTMWALSLSEPLP